MTATHARPRLHAAALACLTALANCTEPIATVSDPAAIVSGSDAKSVASPRTTDSEDRVDQIEAVTDGNTCASCAQADAAGVAPGKDAAITADCSKEIQPDASAIPGEMVMIPAGKFLMGCVPGDGDCEPSENPQHEVYLEAFYIDVFEVTYAAYKICVEVGACGMPAGKGNHCNWHAQGKWHHPVNCVEWFQAHQYCKWAHPQGRLPTEAEWEKAARGGLVGAKFPWGNLAPSCSPCAQNSAVWDDGSAACTLDGTRPVGTAGPNGYGLYDMAGNVREVVNDWFDAGFYAKSPNYGPTGPPVTNLRVWRGGDYQADSAKQLRASQRTVVFAAAALPTQGFRCARSAQ